MVLSLQKVEHECVMRCRNTSQVGKPLYLYSIDFNFFGQATIIFPFPMLFKEFCPLHKIMLLYIKGIWNVCYRVYFLTNSTFNPPINISYWTFDGYQCLLIKCTILEISLPCEPKLKQSMSNRKIRPTKFGDRLLYARNHKAHI